MYFSKRVRYKMAIILDNVKFKTIIHLDTALQQKDDAIIIKLLLKVISNS